MILKNQRDSVVNPIPDSSMLYLLGMALEKIIPDEPIRGTAKIEFEKEVFEARFTCPYSLEKLHLYVVNSNGEEAKLGDYALSIHMLLDGIIKERLKILTNADAFPVYKRRGG